MSSANVTLLDRLITGLEAAGIKRGTRNKTVAEKTGYSLDSVKRILSGNSTLTNRFIQATCKVFSIKTEWVLEGKEPVTTNDQDFQFFPLDNWNGQPPAIFEGERLREVRESLGYSLADLAEQLIIDIDTLQQCEKALIIKDTYIIRKLALLCINLNWVMTGRGEKRLEEWPIVISKENPKSDWSGRSANIIYKIDDLFTTRLKRALRNRSTEWLSNETQIYPLKIEKIISGSTIPSVDELESIAKALGQINPRWLAEKSDSAKEDWEFELFRDASAIDLPYKMYTLCEMAIENYIEGSQGLIKLSSDEKMRIIGALGRLHIKESSQQTEINKDMLRVLIARSRSVTD